MVEAGGHGVVLHAESAATRMLADRTGLTGALARRGFTPPHDRGPVVTDLAVAIVDGATTIAEIDILRHQEDLFGLVASDTTAWRTLAGCDGAAIARIGRARPRTRRHVWTLIAARHGGIPPARAAAGPRRGHRDPPGRHDSDRAQQPGRLAGHRARTRMLATCGSRVVRLASVPSP